MIRRTHSYFARTLLSATCAVCLTAAKADPGKLTVHVDSAGHEISPMLYGLMTEEINHSYDGGLYGELIRNRSFRDDPTRPIHWSLVKHESADGSIAIVRSKDAKATGNEGRGTSIQRKQGTGDPYSLDPRLRLARAEYPGRGTNQPVGDQNPRLCITATNASPESPLGVANEGYWGIPVRSGEHYRVAFDALATAEYQAPLKVALESSDGIRTLATATIAHIKTGWNRYTCTLTAENTEPSTKNRFVIYLEGKGPVYFSYISLFPPTYHNRPNGNRIDLMQKMAAMKPAFLRLPGGNYLEGNTIAERFEWKDTLHDPAKRIGHQCPWGYHSSDGMGLLEFLEWCEDLKMQPILAVYAGYSLQGEHIDPGPKLQPFVDDAIEEIEYAIGGAKTKWGAVRAADGHPAPFKIQYVEIGNEDGFDRSGSYDGRFSQFFDAIRAHYPELQQIATMPVKSRVPDLVDDHYYRTAADMERDAGHYDNYPRTGPKIFVGEWASTEGSPTPTLQAALGDAAWMTGMERNSDLIPISCYAPLLVNVNPGARQWGTNLIGYDALNSFGSPSYYAQAMFANNLGDTLLPSETSPQKMEVKTVAPAPHGGVGVGTWATAAEYAGMKVEQGGTAIYQFDPKTGEAGWNKGRGNWQADGEVIRQSDRETDCRLTTGNYSWKNYTYTLKARKISGAEGFLVMFHVQNEQNYLWWNIGGWGNTQTAIERSANGAKQIIGKTSDVHIDTGRWYDIMIEVSGTHIRCFLDRKLVSEAEDVPGAMSVDPLYVTASRVKASGEVIVKLVNVTNSPQELNVQLEGASAVTGGTCTELAGDPADMNSLEAPTKVAPVVTRMLASSGQFLHSFPAHSVTVLRMRVK